MNMNTMDTLEDVCCVRVRFNEIDSMSRVWHGAYITWFEDGRESFGRHYPGIGYADMQSAGIYAPVYEISARYHAPVLLNETVEIHTTYVHRPGARLDYDYRIYRKSDDTLCAEGHTVQLFIDSQGELMTEEPGYYKEWKERHFALRKDGR